MTSNMTQLIFNTEKDLGTLDIVPQQNFSQISNYVTFLLILRLMYGLPPYFKTKEPLRRPTKDP